MWAAWFEFSLTHAHDPQCKEYDEAAAWPLLIDDFVDYIQRDDKSAHVPLDTDFQPPADPTPADDTEVWPFPTVAFSK